MKRTGKLASICLITMLSITGCGINKEITYKENVSEDELKKPSITQSSLDINVEDNELFIPLYYKDNDILGLLAKKEGAMIVASYPTSIEAKDKMYKVNSDNSISETEDNVIANLQYTTSENSQRGVYAKTKEGKVYYYDRIKGTETEIGVNYKFNYDEDVAELLTIGNTIKGNEEFCFILQGVIEKQNFETIGGSSITDPVLIIKNMKTTEEFILRDEEVIANIIDVVYDKVTESLYFITNKGEIKKIDLINGNIKLIDYGNIDLITPNYLDKNKIYINDKGELVVGRYNSENILLTYNFESKKTKKIENPFKGDGYIEAYFPKYNIVIINKSITSSSMQKEYYIGRIKSDTIEIYDKINYEMGNFNMVEMAPAIINDDGTELIITLAFSNLKDASMPEFSHYEYKKIEIKRGKNE